MSTPMHEAAEWWHLIEEERRKTHGGFCDAAFWARYRAWYQEEANREAMVLLWHEHWWQRGRHYWSYVNWLNRYEFTFVDVVLALGGMVFLVNLCLGLLR